MKTETPVHEIESIAGVCEAQRLGVGRANFLIEVPHGATRAVHFDGLRARLRGKYADDLREFFFVNTDVGAPECAGEIARRLGAAGAGVLVLRCLLPRTFIDCNRMQAYLSGDQMTPLVPSYVREPRDVRGLIKMYVDYQALVRRAYAEVCGEGGHGLILHTYAPRSVDIGNIDENVVTALRAAYRPEQFANWPIRPDVDIICEDADGRPLAPPGLVEKLDREYAAIGVTTAHNDTYRLHAETMGYVHSSKYPGRVVCIEINRELLADPYTPFQEMRIGHDKVRRMAAPIVSALLGLT